MPLRIIRYDVYGISLYGFKCIIEKSYYYILSLKNMGYNVCRHFYNLASACKMPTCPPTKNS